MRRCVTLVCVMAVVCTASVQAAPSPNQLAAGYLCRFLRLYAANATTRFVHCAPAWFDTLAGEESFWVWFTSTRGSHKLYLVARSLSDGTPEGNFYAMSPAAFKARWHPGSPSAPPA